MKREDLEKIGKVIVDCIYEVHKTLGPGLLESVYQMALCREFTIRNIRIESQIPVAVEYKGETLECGFRVDLIVEGEVVLELKSVDALLPIHEAQMINYLHLTKKHLGYLVNFNVPLIKYGIKRKVLGLEQAKLRALDYPS